MLLPYLDREAVTHDLEAVGAQFRATMPAVIAADLAPDLRFTEILDDLDDELGTGLPDWINPPGSDWFVLGPETTSLFLEWDWAMEEASGVALPDFLDAWRDVEGGLENVRLHAGRVRAFGSAKLTPPRSRARKSSTKRRSRS